MGEKIVTLTLRILSWLKIPMMMVMALTLFRPIDAPKPNIQLLSVASEHRENERQVDMNEADIKSLQRRLDLLEALHIDASIASLKATIDYDHALLMTIAGMLTIMVIGSMLGMVRKKQSTGNRE
jgi:hypothetical protein